MPRHQRYLDEFALGKPRGIHLCGNVMRHMKTLRDELNIRTWDSGFPVDFARMREELGPGVQINGGPGIMLLLHGTAAAGLRSDLRDSGKRGQDRRALRPHRSQQPAAVRARGEPGGDV